MMENKPFSGLSLAVTLEEIAESSRNAEMIQSQHKQTTNRRRGNKGSRKWGYMTPGTGKRR